MCQGVGVRVGVAESEGVVGVRCGRERLDRDKRVGADVVMSVVR